MANENQKQKLSYEDFISCIEGSNKDFVNELHNYLTENGCKIEVKEAKSGHMVSYIYNKKTVINYVFRKSGLIVRIYANHVNEYMEFLETLPECMTVAIQKAPVCRRLINPNDCNSKCAMGYDFNLKGERYKKCRISAFMFVINDISAPFIKTFITNELKACA